jgi:hypothetical protein
VGGYPNTGSLQGAAFGALTAGAANGVGHNIGAFAGADFSTPSGLMAKIFTHGVTQGTIARAGASRFGDGALGAFASSLSGPGVKSGVRQAMADTALGGTV